MAISNTTFLPFFGTCMPTNVHEYEGKFNLPDWKIYLAMHIEFTNKDKIWTSVQPIKAIIDTGATATHISLRAVPKEIIELNKDNHCKVQIPGVQLDGINIHGIRLNIPAKNEHDQILHYLLNKIPAFDDSAVIKDFDLYLGMDVLYQAEFCFDGPKGIYYLKFVI
jgi:hypothetical protein